MPRIKFLRDYQVKGTTWVRERQKRKPLQGFEGDSPKYTEGQEIDCTPDVCRKFVSRGVAVELTGKPEPKVRVEPKPEPKSVMKDDAK